MPMGCAAAVVRRTWNRRDGATAEGRGRSGASGPRSAAAGRDQVSPRRTGEHLPARLEHLLGVGAKTVVRWEKGTASRAPPRIVSCVFLGQCRNWRMCSKAKNSTGTSTTSGFDTSPGRAYADFGRVLRAVPGHFLWTGRTSPAPSQSPPVCGAACCARCRDDASPQDLRPDVPCAVEAQHIPGDGEFARSATAPCGGRRSHGHVERRLRSWHGAPPQRQTGRVPQLELQGARARSPGGSTLVAELPQEWELPHARLRDQGMPGTRGRLGALADLVLTHKL